MRKSLLIMPLVMLFLASCSNKEQVTSGPKGPDSKSTNTNVETVETPDTPSPNGAAQTVTVVPPEGAALPIAPTVPKVLPLLAKLDQTAIMLGRGNVKLEIGEGVPPYDVALSGTGEVQEVSPGVFLPKREGDIKITITDSQGEKVILELVISEARALGPASIELYGPIGGSVSPYFSDGAPVERVELSQEAQEYLSIGAGALILSKTPSSTKVLDFTAFDSNGDSYGGVVIVYPKLEIDASTQQLVLSRGVPHRIRLSAKGGLAPYRIESTDNLVYREGYVYPSGTAIPGEKYNVTVTDAKGQKDIWSGSFASLPSMTSLKGSETYFSKVPEKWQLIWSIEGGLPPYRITKDVPASYGSVKVEENRVVFTPASLDKAQELKLVSSSFLVIDSLQNQMQGKFSIRGKTSLTVSRKEIVALKGARDDHNVSILIGNMGKRTIESLTVQGPGKVASLSGGGVAYYPPESVQLPVLARVQIGFSDKSVEEASIIVRPWMGAFALSHLGTKYYLSDSVVLPLRPVGVTTPQFGIPPYKVVLKQNLFSPEIVKEGIYSSWNQLGNFPLNLPRSIKQSIPATGLQAILSIEDSNGHKTEKMFKLYSALISLPKLTIQGDLLKEASVIKAIPRSNNSIVFAAGGKLIEMIREKGLSPRVLFNEKGLTITELLAHGPEDYTFSYKFLKRRDIHQGVIEVKDGKVRPLFKSIANDWKITSPLLCPKILMGSWPEARAVVVCTYTRNTPFLTLVYEGGGKIQRLGLPGGLSSIDKVSFSRNGYLYVAVKKGNERLVYMSNLNQKNTDSMEKVYSVGRSMFSQTGLSGEGVFSGLRSGVILSVGKSQMTESGIPISLAHQAVVQEAKGKASTSGAVHIDKLFGLDYAETVRFLGATLSKGQTLVFANEKIFADEDQLKLILYRPHFKERGKLVESLRLDVEDALGIKDISLVEGNIFMARVIKENKESELHFFQYPYRILRRELENP